MALNLINNMGRLGQSFIVEFLISCSKCDIKFFELFLKNPFGFSDNFWFI